MRRLEKMIETLTYDLKFEAKWPSEGYRTRGRKVLSKLVLEVSKLESRQAQIDKDIEALYQKYVQF